MKVIFWKHQSEILIALPFFLGCSLILIILGTILMIIQSLGFLGMLIFGIVMLFFSLIYGFVNPKIFSKVEYSENGIVCKRFNKILSSITWKDINSIRKIPLSRSMVNIAFVSNNDEIIVELTKKMYDTIMILCPEPYVKTQINEIEEFKWFH